MTVKLLAAWNGNSPGIITLDSTTEARLIAQGLATADLDYQADEDGDFLRGVRNRLTGRIEIFGPNGEQIPMSIVHPAYHTHLYAGNITTDDPYVPDSSGAQNHGVRGANLSIAQMGAAAGYASAVAPVTGALDSVIHVPKTDFDYTAGESLFLYWRGKAAPPAAERNLMGDYINPYGFRVRVDAAGVCDLIMYGSGGSASSGWGHVIADNTLHDIAWYLDGKNRIAYKFYDGALVLTQPNYGLTVGNAVAPNPITIGCNANRANNTGMACATRAFVVMRWAAEITEHPTGLDALGAITKLRASPGRLLTTSDI